MEVRYLSVEEIDSLVRPEELVDVIREMYLEKPLALERVSLTHRDVWIGLMPGVDPATGFVLKIIGIYPRAEPRVRGYLVVSDLDNGEIRFIADAAPATGWRTAAASALAVMLLRDCGPGCRIERLGLVGAGYQGLYHMRVFKSLFRIHDVCVYDVVRGRASRLVESLGGRVCGLEETLETSDVVVTATTSTEPVVKGDLLRRGSVVVSIGAPRPVRELDDRTRERAGCALVDTVYGALHETDDVAGLELVEIGDYLRGRRCVFREIMLYKSVGTSLLDMAFARYVSRRLFTK